MKSIQWFSLVLVFACSMSAGCGGGEGSTLIQPTENYQPSADEQKMQQEMEAARGSGQQ